MSLGVIYIAIRSPYTYISLFCKHAVHFRYVVHTPDLQLERKDRALCVVYAHPGNYFSSSSSASLPSSKMWRCTQNRLCVGGGRFFVRMSLSFIADLTPPTRMCPS